MNKESLFSIVDQTKMFSRNFYLIIAVTTIVVGVAMLTFFPISQFHTKWVQETVISFDEPGRIPINFAINENTVAISTWQSSHAYQNSNSKTPYTPNRNYVYIYNVKTWLQQAELTIPEYNQLEDYGFSFGENIAIDGNTILAGANVFTRSEDSWVFNTKLQPPLPKKIRMVRSIALDGDTTVINFKYATHVFRRNPDRGNWFFEAEIKRSHASRTDYEGAVAIDGDTIVDGYRVFRRSSTNDWLPEAELTLNGKPIETISQVGISGNTIVVGMQTEFNTKDDQRGLAHVFERNPNTGTWEYKTKLVPHDIVPFALYGFGHYIAIDENTVIAGRGFYVSNKLAYALSWFTPKPKGRAYIFIRNKNGRWLRSAKLRPDDKQKATWGSVKISGNRVMFVGSGDRKLYIYKRVD